jgi:hypothetical protein
MSEIRNMHEANEVQKLFSSKEIFFHYVAQADLELVILLFHLSSAGIAGMHHYAWLCSSNFKAQCILMEKKIMCQITLITQYQQTTQNRELA